MLTSSQENNMHLWGPFPHRCIAGRGCCLARTTTARVRPSPATWQLQWLVSSSMLGTHWGDAHHSKVPKALADGKHITCCSQREVTALHPLVAMLTHSWVCSTCQYRQAPAQFTQHVFPGNKLYSLPSVRNLYSPVLLTLWNLKPCPEGDGSERVMWTTPTLRSQDCSRIQPPLNWGDTAVRKTAKPWEAVSVQSPGVLLWLEPSHNVLTRPRRDDTYLWKLVPPWHSRAGACWLARNSAAWGVQCVAEGQQALGLQVTTWDSRIPRSLGYFNVKITSPIDY